MSDQSQPVIIEETFDVHKQDVWLAITELGHMHQWFFPEIMQFRAVKGFMTRFVVDTGGRNFPHLWRIKEVIPLRKITYDWQYEGYEGASIVEFQLLDEDGKTKLRLTHTNTEEYAEDIPEFTRESCVNGWTYFIKERLKKYLNK